MPIETVNIPGSYQVREPNGKLTTYSNGVGMAYSSSRPDRSRERKPSGWLYPTAYEIDVQARRKPLGDLRWNTGHLFSGTVPYVDGNTAQQNHLPFPSGMEDRVVTKALLELKNQSLNIGVALAEAQATANLVGSSATRIARAYQAVKRRDFSSAAQFLGIKKKKGGGLGFKPSNDIPSAWLELQYGWKPLLSDVHGAIQHLAFRAEDRGKWRHTVKGSERIKDQGDYNYTTQFGSKRIVYNRESGMFVRLDYIPGNSFFSAMSQVGVTNPLEVIWEKVPFSFVVDWFLPVGDYLSTLDADLGWIFLSGSKSQFQRTRVIETPGPPSGYYISGTFRGSFRRVTLKRSVYVSSPRPQLPRFKNPVSLGRMANGLALLSSVFGKGGGPRVR